MNYRFSFLLKYPLKTDCFSFYFYLRVNSVINTHNGIFSNDYVILYLKHTARTF